MRPATKIVRLALAHNSKPSTILNTFLDMSR